MRVVSQPAGTRGYAISALYRFAAARVGFFRVPVLPPTPPSAAMTGIVEIRVGTNSVAHREMPDPRATRLPALGLWQAASPRAAAPPGTIGTARAARIVLP